MLTATDINTNTIAGTSKTVAVSINAAAATHFLVSAPSNSLAGNVLVFTVTAEDAQGTTATSYTGTVHINSSDGQALLSSDATLTAGVGIFAATLRTAGDQTLNATDTTNGDLTGTSAAITVGAAAASHFTVSAPALAITGDAVAITVTAKDPFNNTAAGYTGTIHFSSSDAAAMLPGNTTLTNGAGVFSVTLQSLGSQTLTVTDASAATIAGTSGTIATRGLTVTSLTPTSTGFVATFDKPFNPTLLDLYDASTGGGGDDVLLTGPNAPQISFHGSLIVSGNDETITFVKTSNFTSANFNPGTGVLAAGTYTVTFRSACNGFADSLGDPLDGLNNGNPAGGNYVATFVVTAPPAIVGIPAFARGPDSADAINLPNSATTGIPLNVSVGSGITSGKFTLQYNPALLSITGVAVNTSLTGASLSLDAASTPGTAILDFSSPTALTQTGALRLGGLVATVPNSAASLYKSKALLHWSGVTLNSGAIAAEGDDSVEIVAYFGDASGSANGSLSAGDGSDILAVATNFSTNVALGTLGGLSAFPLADPVIIADLNNDGLVDASDVTLLNSVLAGIPRAQIPTIPTGLPIAATGPDPNLSLPAVLQVTPGAIVVVPVNIDTAHPSGSTGATEAILALKYNPQVVSVSAADVRAGSLTNGWQLTTVVNAQAGEIGIDLWSTTPIQTTAGGSLVTITMHILSTAPAGSTDLMLMNQVNPTGQRVFTTTVSDSLGAFVLQMNSGQWAGGSGQFALANTPMPADESAANMQSTAHCQLPTTHFLELAFTELGLAAMMVQETAFGQPAPVLNSELGDQVLNGTKGLTPPIQANGAAQTDWTSDNYLAYLWQSAKNDTWMSEFEWFDAHGDEEIA